MFKNTVRLNKRQAEIIRSLPGELTEDELCRCKRCVHCLKCVAECPAKALDFKLTFPMRRYLKKKKLNELRIYDASREKQI